MVGAPAKGALLFLTFIISEPLSLGLVRGVAMQGIPYDAIMSILAEQMKARIVRRSVHNERETNRLTTFTAVVGTYPDIVIRIVSTALVNLMHDAYRIFHVKHRQSPHLPVGIARMGIVGELYIYRPIIVKAILYLLADLIVGQ